jgi:hypothetical protein
MASTGVGSNMAYGTVEVDGTAEVIVNGRSTRKSIIIQNRDAALDLHVGPDSSITASNTIKLAPGESIRFDDYNGPVYGIGSGAGTTTNYIEVY